MEAVIDQAGRIVLPKPIRDALGLLPGTKVDISPYGAGGRRVTAPAPRCVVRAASSALRRPRLARLVSR